MANPPIRRDVYKMEPWDATLLWYARAVAEMQKRPIAESASWRFQAAIHEYITGEDPLAQPGETLPSQSVQDRFWNQCQHFSWYFLPWHRMYLGIFEQIVARTVQDLGGPAGWTLPYWNYSDASNPDARRLPQAFRDEWTPDKVANPLRVEARTRACNLGRIMATPADVQVRSALAEEVFDSSPEGGASSFGGPQTGFSHDSGGAMGVVDRVPHGSMHNAVGGQTGWMSFFNTAALDPIFWLHHANIDRLWTVWLRRDPSHVNPNDPRWLTSLPFPFIDATGQEVSFTPSQVTDTTAMPAPLASYAYEDESDPLAASSPMSESVEPERRSDAMPEQRMTEMVGATQEPIVLAGRPATARVAVAAPTGPAAESLNAENTPGETFLNIENVTGSVPQAYEVYVNLPEGASPDQHPELLAGILPMFGLREASRNSESRSGSGLHYVLRVGEIVQSLQARGGWSPGDVRLTFVPHRRDELEEDEMAESMAAEEPIRVGRVSVHVG
jgi:tyrosinase